MELETLMAALRRFNDERDWAQFHSPRNLLLALVGEVGEASALLQWVDDSDVEPWLDDPPNRELWESELADILAYLLQLADRTGIDIGEALTRKIARNQMRYPVERSKGSSAKYET